MRDDSAGFFWEDLQIKAKRGTFDRPLATIPETGWVAPTEFPRLCDATVLAIDTETKDTELTTKGPGFRRSGDEHAEIVGLAVGTTDGGRWYFPMRHTICPEQNLNPDHVLEWARDNICIEGQTKIGANLMYDVDALWSEQVPVTGPFIDVQHAECLLNENRFEYNLEALSQDYFGEGKVRGVLQDWVERSYGDVDDYRANIWRSPPCLVGPYAESDVDLPIRLWREQQPALERQRLGSLFGLETDIIPLLVRMRQRGVRVDLEYANTLDDELTAGMAVLDGKLRDIAGRDINVGSGDDLARVFDAAGLPYLKTPTGKASFRKGWLESIEHPVAKLIIQRRTLVKFRNTFVRGYILGAHVNGRVHCLFHPLKGEGNGTVSGRFSSSLPNLTNIPIRDEYWGPRLRALFLGDEGELWGRHDWSQIEYRLLAHYAQGPSGEDVRQRYREDPTTDFHAMTQKIIFDVSGKKLERIPTKTINFGLTYGMGEPELCKRLGLTTAQGTEMFSIYHNGVPFVKKTYEVLAKTASERGWLKTFLNRRARFDLFEPWYRDPENYQPALPYDQAVEKYGPRIRRAYTHKALNRLLQGSAADLLKYAMREFDRAGLDRVIPLLLTCHDEFGNTVARTKEAFEAMNELRRIMETCLQFQVPILAEQTIDINWGKCK